MKACRIFFGIAVVVALMPCVSIAQDEEEGLSLFSTEATATAKTETRVTAVYGVSADDYLPSTTTSRKQLKQQLKPQVRSRASHPSLDLPDAFYFIGAPVFIFLFLRILVIFLNDFEEKRKEELRISSREIFDID